MRVPLLIGYAHDIPSFNICPPPTLKTKGVEELLFFSSSSRIFFLRKLNEIGFSRHVKRIKGTGGQRGEVGGCCGAERKWELLNGL